MEEEKETSDDLAKWISDQIKESKSHSSEWRKNARENYAFFAGKQWSDEDEAAMKESGRLPIVFNRIARTINAVSGLEVQNRQEVRFIPREIGDVGVNEVLTGAAEWIRDSCDAEDEESESFQDVLICGMGWTDTRLDYESDVEGTIIIDRVDPLEMGWDQTAKKRNLDDARFFWRAKKVSPKDFKAMWPEHEPTMSSDSLDEGSTEPHNANEAKNYTNDQGGRKDDKTITVIQFQWWEKEPYHMVQTEAGGVVEFTSEKWEKVSQYVEAKGLKHVKRTRKCYKQAFVNGNEILEQGPSPYKDGFTFRPITGLRNRNENTWFGLVDLMKDPQRYANKWLSQIVFILSTNSKGGLLAEQDAFVNPKKAEEEWASPDSITWLKSRALVDGKIKEKTMANYPAGLDRILQYAVDAVNDVAGANLELLGLANRDQPGILETQRKQAGVTMLAVFFDSLRRYRKEQGRVLAYMIKEYISDGRLIRILGNNGHEQFIQLVRDQNTCKYDVIVDDAPTSPNMKEKVFVALSQLLPQLMQAGVPAPPELLDYTPLPSSMVQKWKKYIEEKSKQGPPPDPKVEAEKARLQLDQQRFQMEAQNKQQAAALDAELEMRKLQHKSMIETQQLEAEIQIQRERNRAELEIQRERMFGELMIKSEVEKNRPQPSPA